MGNVFSSIISILLPLAPIIASIFHKSKDPRPIHAPREEELPRPAWLTPGINWAVCGTSGVGKSSFINRVRGIRPGQPGAAQVGVTETTTNPTPYCFENNGQLRLWDLPGGATMKFPADKYVVEFGLRHMSGVIIITATRATQLDVEIMNLLNHYKVPWYYVRTKVDIDIENNLNDHGTSETDTLSQIKNNLIENMRASEGGKDLSHSRVFAISNRLGNNVGDWNQFAGCLATDLRISYQHLVDVQFGTSAFY